MTDIWEVQYKVAVTSQLDLDYGYIMLSLKSKAKLS